MHTFLARARATSALVSQNKGQNILPDKLLQTLLEDLQAGLGEPVSQPDFKLHAGGKLVSRVFAVLPNKVALISKILSELDFSVTKLPTTGYLGGVRVETNGKTTVVNYTQLSGVLVISTNLAKHF